MKTLRLALLAFAALSPVSLIAQDPAVSRESAPQTAPPPMTRQQIGREMGLEFDKHDNNHDGYLSWQEWEESNRNDPEFKANGRTVFDHMDSDHDNRLARQEMVNWSLRVFDCLDDNRDGTIADAEGQTNIERCLVNETGVPPQSRPAN